MLRISKRVAPSAKSDVLEVVHNEIPQNAAGAGAAPIPETASAGMTWRAMLRAVAVTEVVGLVGLLVVGLVYGLDPFYPLALGGILFAVAAWWVGRKTKASTIYTLVMLSLVLLMFGVGFAAWTGFAHVTSWFEETFAVVTVLVPIMGVVAAVATLRHHDGADAARTPAITTAAISGVLVVASVIGSIATGDPARLPGDVSLAAKNFKFEQASLTAKSGNVAIYFENKDPFTHNIKIEGHGGSSDTGGRRSIRHVFTNLAPGTYAYFCSLHKEEMHGTITVT